MGIREASSSSSHEVGEGIIVVVRPLSLSCVEGRRGRQATSSVPHVEASPSSSSGGGLVGHWSSTASVVVCGRWARWAKASAFALEANGKGHGGKASASARVSSSSSIPHILVSSSVVVRGGRGRPRPRLSAKAWREGVRIREGVVVVVNPPHPHIVIGRRARWARFSASAFEVNGKGRGGKASARESSSSLSSDGGGVIAVVDAVVVVVTRRHRRRFGGTGGAVVVVIVVCSPPRVVR